MVKRVKKSINVSKNLSKISFYLYVVAIVAIVAIFYLVQNYNTNSVNVENNENTITGNVVVDKVAGKADLGVTDSFITYNEDETKTMHVSVRNLDQPVKDIVRKSFTHSLKAHTVEKASELGVLNCKMTAEGPYNLVQKKNFKSGYGQRYTCTAVFQIPKYDNSESHAFTVVDANGYEGRQYDIKNTHMWYDTDFDYGGSTYDTYRYVKRY